MDADKIMFKHLRLSARAEHVIVPNCSCFLVRAVLVSEIKKAIPTGDGFGNRLVIILAHSASTDPTPR